MRPIPVVFHIGALQIHTYGVGLALTFYFGYRYFMRRLRDRGFTNDWLATTFVWIIIAAIVGARVFHVVANWSYYSANLGDIFAIWHGGLSSFGGLAFAIPVGLWSAHRRCPSLRPGIAGDLVAPVLAAAWAMGRLLGPQLMVAGGGKPTSSWVGMYYAGEVGKRLPVPIIQAIECGAVFLIALWAERFVLRRGGPTGFVTSVTVALWCLSRFFDESLWLTHDSGTTAIEIASICLFVIGISLAGFLVLRTSRHQPASDNDDETAERQIPLRTS